MTLSLFDRPGHNGLDWLLDGFEPGDPDGLRYYQRTCVDAVVDKFQTFNKLLAVMPTGGGKTRVFCALAKHWPGSVLILAHRDELVTQAAEELERATGEMVDREQADCTSSHTTRLVVGSVQSVTRPKRLERLGKDRFSLLIADEAHIFLAPTFRRAFEFFNAKKLGVTATPDRGDEKALGQIFDDVAFSMDILQGIDAGYLVPVKGRSVRITGIDLSQVSVDRKTRDLNEGEMDRVMTENIDAIVATVLEREPDRQAICFFPGVASAEYASVAFNARIMGSAAFVCGSTPKEERRAIVKRFKRGDFQFLCNCQVATLGFDAPTASNIVLARPTLSRCLYAQMVGRGTRVLPYTVDHIPGPEGSAARRALVAASKKPDCVIMDFCGNAGRHDLMTPHDLLGGDFTAEEVERAKKRAAEKKGDDTSDPRSELERARQEMRDEARRRLSVRVTAEIKAFEPFTILGMDPDAEKRHQERYGSRPATPNMRNALAKMGLREDAVNTIAFHAASKLIAERDRRRDLKLATYKQMQILRDWGVNDPNITFERASAAITYISQKGWGRKGQVDPHVLNEILKAKPANQPATVA